MKKNIFSFIRQHVDATKRRVLGTITNVATSHPVIALTFDDGPHPLFTPKLLKVLMRHHAQATFFMLGEYAKKYPKIVESVARDGHAIGNHSWDHPSFPLISSRERRRQIKSCEHVLIPQRLRIFRPPFGHQNMNTRLDLFLLGYQGIGWDIDANDWLDHDARFMADQIEKQMKPGSIILFHDALFTVIEERYENREQTIDAIDMLLGDIGDLFRFITVPELLQHGQPHRVILDSQGESDFLKRLRKPGDKSWRYIR